MIQIAKIGRSVGVYGGLKLHLLTDFPQILNQDLIFFAKPSSRFCNHQLELKLKSYQEGVAIFVGYETMEKAKELTNYLLFTTLEDTRKYCKLEENEVFYFDVIGCEIVEDDEVLGVVSEIERIAQTDYLIIKANHQDLKLPKSFMLPYINRYILKCSLQEKRIYTQGAKEIWLAS